MPIDRSPEKALAAAPEVTLYENKPKPERLGAILIDWDNLVIPVEIDLRLPVWEINIHLMRALLEASLKFVDRAHLFVFTAEGQIDRNYFLKDDTKEFDLELIVVPSEKNAADEAIRLKAKELLQRELTCKEVLNTFIFASGDGYFIETAKKLKRAGKKVVLMPYSRDHLHRDYQFVLGSNNIVFLKSYIR